jgi:hypothetical protein
MITFETDAPEDSKVEVFVTAEFTSPLVAYPASLPFPFAQTGGGVVRKTIQIIAEGKVEVGEILVHFPNDETAFDLVEPGIQVQPERAGTKITLTVGCHPDHLAQVPRRPDLHPGRRLFGTSAMLNEDRGPSRGTTCG